MLLDTLAPWQQEFPHKYLWWEDKMLRNPPFYPHTLFHVHVIHYFKISNLFRLQAVIAVYKLYLLLNTLKKGALESQSRHVALPYCSRNLFSPPFQFSCRSRKELPGKTSQNWLFQPTVLDILSRRPESVLGIKEVQGGLWSWSSPKSFLAPKLNRIKRKRLEETRSKIPTYCLRSKSCLTFFR